MVAPVNGDTLVFQGENAVAENDFDSTVQFAAIYMSNSVPFTIRGNTLYLSGSRIFRENPFDDDHRPFRNGRGFLR